MFLFINPIFQEDFDKLHLKFFESYKNPSLLEMTSNSTFQSLKIYSKPMSGQSIQLSNDFNPITATKSNEIYLQFLNYTNIKIFRMIIQNHK
jgi:hypothetical protein